MQLLIYVVGLEPTTSATSTVSAHCQQSRSRGGSADMQALPLHNFLKRRDAETRHADTCVHNSSNSHAAVLNRSGSDNNRRTQRYGHSYYPRMDNDPEETDGYGRCNVASASVSPLLLWQRHPDGDPSAKQCAVYRQTRRRPSMHRTCCIQQCKNLSKTTLIYFAVYFNQKQSFILPFTRSRRRGTLAEPHMDERGHNILGRDFASGGASISSTPSPAREASELSDTRFGPPFIHRHPVWEATGY